MNRRCADGMKVLANELLYQGYIPQNTSCTAPRSIRRSPLVSRFGPFIRFSLAAFGPTVIVVVAVDGDKVVIAVDVLVIEGGMIVVLDANRDSVRTL